MILRGHPAFELQLGATAAIVSYLFLIEVVTLEPAILKYPVALLFCSCVLEL
jgi:hypothetical protein